jgi:hypothetical protein
MKEISIKEIREIISSIENKGYVAGWKDWAMKWYGPTAYKVRIDIGSEYNDEGYSTQIDSVDVFSKSGKRLAPTTKNEWVKEEIERLRLNRGMTVDSNAIYADFKKSFPMLDEEVWKKMTDAEVVKHQKVIDHELQRDIESSIREDMYDIDYPGSGDVGENYSNMHEFILDDEEFVVPKFYVEE